MFTSTQSRESGVPTLDVWTNVRTDLRGIVVDGKDAFDGLEFIDKHVFDERAIVDSSEYDRLKKIKDNIITNEQKYRTEGKNVDRILGYLELLITFAERKISSLASSTPNIQNVSSAQEAVHKIGEDRLLKILDIMGTNLSTFRPATPQTVAMSEEYYRIVEILPEERRQLFKTLAAAQDLSIIADINQYKMNVDQTKVWENGKSELGQKFIQELLNNPQIDKMYTFMMAELKGLPGSSGNYTYEKIDKESQNSFQEFVREKMKDVVPDKALFLLAWTWFIDGGYIDEAYAYRMGAETFASLAHTVPDDGKHLTCINPLRMIAYKICAYEQSEKDDLAAVWLPMFSKRSIINLHLSDAKTKQLLERWDISAEYWKTKFETEGLLGFIDLGQFDKLLPVFGEAMRKGVVGDAQYHLVYKGYAAMLDAIAESIITLLPEEQAKSKIATFVKDGLGRVKLMFVQNTNGRRREDVEEAKNVIDKILGSCAGMTKFYIQRITNLVQSNIDEDMVQHVGLEFFKHPTLNPISLVSMAAGKIQEGMKESREFHAFIEQIRSLFKKDSAAKFENLPGTPGIGGKLYEEVSKWLEMPRFLHFNKYVDGSDFRVHRQKYLEHFMRYFKSMRRQLLVLALADQESPFRRALDLTYVVPPPCPYDKKPDTNTEEKKH